MNLSGLLFQGSHVFRFVALVVFVAIQVMFNDALKSPKVTLFIIEQL